MTKYRLFSTKLGTFVIWANNRDQVGLRTEWKHNRNSSAYDGLDLSTLNEFVTINRVEYSLHLFLQRAPGLLAEVTEKHQPWRCKVVESSPGHSTTWAYDGYDTSMLTRRDSDMSRDNYHGSPAARGKVVEGVMIRLASWLDSAEGVAFLAEGQERDDDDTIKFIDSHIAEHEEVVLNLLRLKARLSQGRSITADERSFARYVRIDNNLKKG